MEKYLTNPKAIKYIDQLGGYFKDLPHLPKGLVEFIVKVSPFLAGLGGVLSIFSAISMFSVVLNFSPFMKFAGYGYGRNYMFYTLVAAIAQAAVGALLLMAYKPLKEKLELGWLYLYYVVIISILLNIVALTFSMSSIIYTIIWVMIDLYLIYELRDSYKSAKKSTSKKAKK